MKRFLSFFALWLCSLSAPLRAQSDTQLLFTTGTSTVGTDGQRWIYIVWDSADPAIMAGRCFSVNFRPGTAEDSGNYTRQAVVKPLGHRALTGANALPGKQLLESFLSRGRYLGENMTQLDSLLADSLRGLSTTAPALPPARVDRLAALLAREDAVTQSEALPMLRRLSPSVAMSLGQAWAAPVSVAAGAPVTVELRDFDEGTGTDRGVVGRVTLNASGVTDLPSAGPPVQVPDLTSTGDLNIQMRWGFTPDLARRQAQLQGFTVWRVSKTLGAAQPWIGSAPNVSQMNALVTANPEFSILTLPPAYVSGTDVLVNVQSGGSFSLGLARVWNGKAVFRPSPFIPATGYEVRSVAGDVTSCVAGFHHRNAPGSTKIQPVRLGFNAPAGMTEYRVYRKVDDGELGMVKHGEVSVPVGSPISLEDVGLPATSACLNYYVQTFDRDGNSSPLQRLGDCVRIVAPLPAPTVSQPTYSGDGSTARVILSWSAPAAGVERFEILADPDDGGEADPDDGGEADPDDGGEIFIRPTAGGLATLSGIWQQTGQPAFTRGYFSARDFTTGKSRRTATSPGRIFVTPYIGTGAGALADGPVFTQEFDVKPGVDYRFVVTALGTSNGQVQSRSAASAAVRVRWAPPPPAPSPDCTLPWPFRDLPPVTKFHPDIVAKRFVPAAGESATLVQGETPIWPIGPRDNWPVGVRIGRILGQQAWALGTLAGQTTPATTDDDSVNFTADAFVDPDHGFLNNALFTSRGSSSRSSRPLLPVVMYRRQEANTLYPSPPDTIVQCSPRITGLAWQNNAAGPRLRDPNIGVSGVGIAPADLPQIKGPGVEFPPACSVNLYLLDTKPVIDGARYHYYLVAFGSDGAPSEVIDAGTVDIP